MKSDYIEELETLIVQGKGRLEDLDQELNAQIAKKKVLDEIFGSSSEEGENTPRESVSQSMKTSQKSALSQDSQFIEDQIARVKNFMRQQGKVRKDQNIDLNERTFKRTNRSKTISLLAQRYNWKQITKFDLQVGETDLHELSEDFFSRQQSFSQKRNMKNSKKIEIQRYLAAKNQNRQRQLAFQRQCIRNQLIKQQIQKEIKVKQNQNIAKTEIRNYDMDFSATLKLERTKQLSRILKQIQRGKHQTNVLYQKVKRTQAY